jgi:hypothetical protein
MAKRMDWEGANRRRTVAPPSRRDRRMDASADRLLDPNWVDGRRVLWLSVPFAQKETAKSLGARWNPDKRQWWIFADVDREPFLPWLSDWDRPAPLRKHRDFEIQVQAERQAHINAERRARWHEVYPDQPWPGDA